MNYYVVRVSTRIRHNRSCANTQFKYFLWPISAINGCLIKYICFIWFFSDVLPSLSYTPTWPPTPSKRYYFFLLCFSSHTATYTTTKVSLPLLPVRFPYAFTFLSLSKYFQPATQSKPLCNCPSLGMLPGIGAAINPFLGYLTTPWRIGLPFWRTT